MIPKVIHYCWFGRKHKPQNVIEFIDSWKINNPDYVIKEWNEDNFDYKALTFTKEAYEVKKYAYVSDVARLYALYYEGGIYLDTDVRVLKNFDVFLNNTSFIGLESPFRISTACIGSQPGLKWIGMLLAYYRNQSFITRFGNLNYHPNTLVITDYLNKTFPEWKEELKIFDIDIFSAKLFPSMNYYITNDTICVHEFAGTWIKRVSFFDRIINLYLKMKIKYSI